MLFLKNFLGGMLYPIPLFCLILLLSFVLWRYKQPRWAKISFAVAFLFLFFVSYDFGSYLLTRPLERIYPQCNIEENLSTRYVIVLGGGSTSDASIPVTSQLSNTSVIRITEGVRIMHALDSATLILTGGKVFDSRPIAHLAYELATGLGVDSSRIILIDNANDTETEARHVAEVIGDTPAILVTSAAHMFRASALFTHAGVTVIPAPTDHKVKTFRFSPHLFWPSSDAITTVKRSVHEYLGILWASLRGKL